MVSRGRLSQLIYATQHGTKAEWGKEIDPIKDASENDKWCIISI
jgi:hypothetical protein